MTVLWCENKTFIVEGEGKPHHVSLESASRNQALFRTVAAGLRYCEESGIRNPVVRSWHTHYMFQLMGLRPPKRANLRDLCQEIGVLQYMTGARLEIVDRATMRRETNGILGNE